MPQNQLTEKNMLFDSIMTEKYVSSAYNTSIMESVNEEVFKTLQHIQQEEQIHGQLFFQMMHKKGWYSVQPFRSNQKSQQELNNQISSQFDNRINSIEQNT